MENSLTMSVQSNQQLPNTLGLTFTVAAVARRLGVASATLRTWDRRYGIGPSSHEAGAHRRYTTEDVARLETMRRMVNAGVPPAHAAQIASQAAPAELPQVRLETAPIDVPMGGGDVIALGAANNYARGLARAALSLDSMACTAAINQQISQRGVLWTWTHMITPVMVGLGQRWESTQRGVEVEHLLSECVISAFNVHAAHLEHPINSRPVLLACAPEEMHSLTLYAVAAALSEHSIAVRILGPRVPHDSLVSAMNRMGPSAVLVWAQLPDNGDLTRLAGLPHLRPVAKIFAGGPGWNGIMPTHVHKLNSLAEAVNELASAALL